MAVPGNTGLTVEGIIRGKSDFIGPVFTEVEDSSSVSSGTVVLPTLQNIKLLKKIRTGSCPYSQLNETY